MPVMLCRCAAAHPDLSQGTSYKTPGRIWPRRRVTPRRPTATKLRKGIGIGTFSSSGSCFATHECE
eukprot:3449715-Pyramimonas_sp.AAC.1